MKLVKTEKCGSRIVVGEDINLGYFIIEYVGQVNRHMVLNKTYNGNKTRYINHSLCTNIEIRKLRIHSETRIHIFITCDIHKG